jgi:CIC family chloride channel protein
VTNQRLRLLLESAGLGVVGALAARLFTWMLAIAQRFLLTGISGYGPPSASGDGGAMRQTIGPHGLWLVPVATTLGGLLSGFLVYTFAPEAEGHGTDTAIAAFHRAAGVVRARVAPLKMVASAITIGSGGAAGREGPTALITGAVGSLYATLVKHSDEERRILLLAGMAAGLSAIFRTPMGTGVFAIEALYNNMDFESTALLYTMLASGVAYAVNGLFTGWSPLFHVVVSATPPLHDYGWYLALGLLAGIVSTVLPEVFYRTRDLFHRLPIPPMVKPAIGGLCVGLIALKLPQVLGGGYGWMQMAMNGSLGLKLLLVLMTAKLVAFALTVASGGSGGVFAPSLYVGAMLGGACAILFHQPSAIFAVVGMAAVFGAAGRVPIATMLMVTEMAGGYQLLVPAGCAVMVSYLTQAMLSERFRYRSLYQAQVPLRSDSPAHYIEQVRGALTLLGRRRVQADSLGHLDLLRLLRSQVRFDLPGGEQLQHSALQQESRFAGHSVAEFYQDPATQAVEIVSIVRREHFILPHPDTRLEAGDRLMLITSEAARKNLEMDLTPLQEGEQISPLAH